LFTFAHALSAALIKTTNIDECDSKPLTAWSYLSPSIPRITVQNHQISAKEMFESQVIRGAFLHGTRRKKQAGTPHDIHRRLKQRF
jgi:hypothetical protein